MSYLIRLSKSKLKLRPQCIHHSRFISQHSEEMKMNFFQPVQLSWSNRKLKMQMESNCGGQLVNFSNSAINCPDCTLINSRTYANSIGKIMEEKQARMNSENNLVSLDPNTSMWQHSFQEENPINPEKKADFCNSIQTFYKKRCEDGDKQSAGPIDRKINTSGPMGMSLYSQISKKRQTRFKQRRSVDSLMDQEADMENQYEEEEEERDMTQHIVKRKRADDGEHDCEQPLQYKPVMRTQRPEINDKINAFKLATERNLQTIKQNAYKQRASRSPFERNTRSKTGRNKNEEESQEDATKTESLEYSVYDDTSSLNYPIYNSPHRADDQIQEKLSTAPKRFTRNTEENSISKHSSKQASVTQFIDNDNNDYIGAYSAASPPEPLFKPSTNIVSGKMKHFTENLYNIHDLKYL